MPPYKTKYSFNRTIEADSLGLGDLSEGYFFQTLAIKLYPHMELLLLWSSVVPANMNI